MTKKSVEKSIQSLRNRRDNIKNKISTATLQKFNTILSYYEDRKFLERKLLTNSSIAF